MKIPAECYGVQRRQETGVKVAKFDIKNFKAWKRKSVAQTLKLYPNVKDFLNVCNMHTLRQVNAGLNEIALITKETFNVRDLPAMYGEKTDITFISGVIRFAQIALNINEGARLDDFQLYECGYSLAKKLGRLTVGEVADFIDKLIAGRYGKITYRLNPSELTEYAQKYIEDRDVLIYKHEEIKRYIERREAPYQAQAERERLKAMAILRDREENRIKQRFDKMGPAPKKP